MTAKNTALHYAIRQNVVNVSIMIELESSINNYSFPSKYLGLLFVNGLLNILPYQVNKF